MSKASGFVFENVDKGHPDIANSIGDIPKLIGNGFAAACITSSCKMTEDPEDVLRYYDMFRKK